MKTFGITTLWVLSGIIAGNAWAAAQVRVIAQVDTSKPIYMGQRFVYQILIDGHSQPGQVDISPLAAYAPQSAGNQDHSQTSISIINGRRTQTVTKRYVMNYTLAVARPGQITLPSLSVIIDGKPLQTNPVTVNILKPGTTDKLDLAVELSDTSCYVGQAVVLTLKAYVAAGADVGDFQFDVPVFQNPQFIFEDPIISDPKAKEYALSNSVSAFVSQRAVTHNGKRFTEVAFSKVLIPQQAGEVALGTTTLSAALSVGQSRPRSLFDDFGMFGSRKQYSRFMVQKESPRLTVHPLPEQGQPKGFYGLVGQYTIEASATPTQVNVGDPITLTIRIGGNRFLKPVQWPKLSEIPELIQNFKIPTEKASPTVVSGYKQFVQTIRANSDRVTEIPALELPYFDTDQGLYRIAKTDPIELKVAPTKVLTSGDLDGNQATPVNRKVEAIKMGLAANYEDLDALVDREFTLAQAVTSPLNLIVWLVPLLGLVGTSVFKAATFSTPERVIAKQKRQAAGQALRQLKAALSLQGQACSEALGAALKFYLGQRCHRTAASLTPVDCYELIMSETADTDLALQYKTLLEMSEASYYSANRTEVESEHVNQAIDLVRRLEKKIAS